MLFTQFAFILGFLPLAFAGFFVLARWSKHAAAIYLFLASLFFYGYWAPVYVLLLLASISGNFIVGGRIARHAGTPAGKRWLVFGVAANLAALGWFKYANFFVRNLDLMTGLHADIGHVVLPIGISFFTFTQIAFLADTWSKGVKDYRFAHYGLFVTYFPHLIAGPILHHRQMMPQFDADATYRPRTAWIAAGLAIFALGLFKKVVLADGIAPYADVVFDAARDGAHPTTREAWLAALSYTFQLYFDFSGYSDMAIGLSWLFGVQLPWNFDSPYKAENISDFWRRWHMSLSAFLRDYLYIALGGNRRGKLRRYGNLMATMLLGGLWHGANWTFVVWGGLHGVYLVINHAIHGALPRPLHRRLAAFPPWRAAAWALTFVAVVIAWVFFRAADLGTALGLFHVMFSPRLPAVDPLFYNAGLDVARGWSWCVALAAVAWLGPNSNRLGLRLRERLEATADARWLVAGSAMTLILMLAVINRAREAVSAFIYFNF